jgi:hypothetical protein
MSTPLRRDGDNLVRMATSYAKESFLERAILHLELLPIQSTIILIYLLPFESLYL